jgi:hypothetical protein
MVREKGVSDRENHRQECGKDVVGVIEPREIWIAFHENQQIQKIHYRSDDRKDVEASRWVPLYPAREHNDDVAIVLENLPVCMVVTIARE